MGYPELETVYPWTERPLIVGAPMRLISTAPLAVAISKAGGIGFIGAGTDLSTLDGHLSEAAAITPPELLSDVLPIGVGVITHAASLQALLAAIEPSKHDRPPPCAIWLFAPEKPEDLKEWAEGIRAVSPLTKIWIQVGNVSEALQSTQAAHPDVLVVQGSDAGGHGLARGASIISLVPECMDALDQQLVCTGQLNAMPHIVAAGGIADARGAAAGLALGADAVCLGTRFLASNEANVAKGYQEEVLRASDGGLSTVRSRVYDRLRGTDHWPERFGGRGLVNASYEDWQEGRMDEQENSRLYEEALQKGDAGWGPDGRLTTYAGTAVGLVKQLAPAGEIVSELREKCKLTLHLVGGDPEDPLK